MGVSLVTLGSMYATADKQHWRELAGDVARVAPLGFPVITYPYVTATFVDMYRPDTLSNAELHVEVEEPLLEAVGGPDAGPDAAWYAYGQYTRHEVRHQELVLAGFSRVMHREYWYPLYLDLYLRPGAAIGAPVDVNGASAGSGSDIPGWSLPPDGVQLGPDAAVGRAISLEGDGSDERYLIGSTSAAANLYELDFEVRSTLTSGGARAFLICASADGAWTDIYPDAGGALIVPADGEWHSTTIVGLCSAGTDHVLMDLRNGGAGTVSYRRVELRELAVPEG